MAEEKDNPETREKKELRDLKPKKDVKGGARNFQGHTDKRPPVRTSEIDFLNWE